MVAAVSLVDSGTGMPNTRMPKPERTRMHYRRLRVFAQVLTHPGDALAPDDVFGIDQRLDFGNGGNVTAHDDDELEKVQPGGTSPALCQFGNDARDAYDVVLVLRQLPRETFQVGKSSSVHGAEMLCWIIIRPQER